MPAHNEVCFFNESNFLLVARQFFQPEDIRQLYQAIEHERSLVSDTSKRGQMASHVGVAPDSVRLKKKWYSIWQKANVALLSNYVNDYCYVIYPPQIRTVDDRKGFVPWHQDIRYMKALGYEGHRRIVTCFVPLDENSNQKPNLQFYLNPDQMELAHLHIQAKEINQFDLKEEDQPDTNACVSYDLQRGDALIFGQLVLHQTYVATDSFLPRHSMEFRLTTQDELVAGKDYYHLPQQQFYVP